MAGGLSDPGSILTRFGDLPGDFDLPGDLLFVGDPRFVGVLAAPFPFVLATTAAGELGCSEKYFDVVADAVVEATIPAPSSRSIKTDFTPDTGRPRSFNCALS